MGADLRAADAAIRRFMDLTDGLITLNNRSGRAAMRDLLTTLAWADRRLVARLMKVVEIYGGMSSAMTPLSLVTMRVQAFETLLPVQARLSSILESTTTSATRASLRRTQQLVNRLEGAFMGAEPTFRLDPKVAARVRTSLLSRHATSVDRYGSAMIATMERELQRGLTQGLTQGQMVARLRRMGGPAAPDVSLAAVEVNPGVVVRVRTGDIPEGLFMRHRSWAVRIVRTEIAEAQNATAMAGIEASTGRYKDMKKKILAVLDMRTAPDSLGVHGQVREISAPFMDGSGRTYLRPPARPNDREMIIPWRGKWSATPMTRPLSQARQRQLEARNERAQRRRARAQRRREREQRAG